MDKDERAKYMAYRKEKLSCYARLAATIMLAREFVDQSKDFRCTVNRSTFNPLRKSHMNALSVEMDKDERAKYMAYRKEKLSCYNPEKASRGLKMDQVLDWLDEETNE
ncbi:hypothetical protein SARC_05694 [Sphaeroforma arctica JP610]|uniref:Uncharacterized protein n=1 Tax=Sphaeroforma arctica JP610 TaxID=667725 RepID=A0A0L0FZL9_9EUKA|nr:hypothetical protein SARC_05694 [Sphaeroforma arctica JP610]KNC82011.1 hypothetical protein SARC_05694 [Sphaeroforma arctica JP610]|eukprot:XP_014155913.1 hypothetical protein SARC_05694 [Sphaeroforma arctica JP610]